jgi:hypothetical protein
MYTDIALMIPLEECMPPHKYLYTGLMHFQVLSLTISVAPMKSSLSSSHTPNSVPQPLIHRVRPRVG